MTSDVAGLPRNGVNIGLSQNVGSGSFAMAADLHLMAVRPWWRSGAAGASEEPSEERPRRTQCHPGSEEHHDPGHEKHGAEGRCSASTTVDR